MRKGSLQPRFVVALIALALLVAAAVFAPGPASAATCSQYPNQKAAQEAADTVDADGDGIYCESLPCPCSSEAGGGGSPPPPPPPPPPSSSCTKTKTVKRIVFSKARYPNIRAHYVRAVRNGWPRILVINRKGAKQRRAKLLTGIPTVDGYDRDEYPPAVGRGRGTKALKRGINPIGWKADVEYVPSSENQSHGAKLGAKLKKLCNGVRFRYIFR